MSDQVINDAIRLRDKLLDVSRELSIKLPRNDTDKELNALDAETCKASAAMLQKLGTEVTRLRLGIGHFHYGKMTRLELSRMTEDWNGDKDRLS